MNPSLTFPKVPKTRNPFKTMEDFTLYGRLQAHDNEASSTPTPAPIP